MEFRVDNLTAFDVPLSYVSHAQTAKNEVAIEFHPNDDAPVSLTEMRFYVPGDSSNKTDPVQVGWVLQFWHLLPLCVSFIIYWQGIASALTLNNKSVLKATG